MIPIKKNIIVIDEQGNPFDATYLKRAKGLAKIISARFVNKNTSCHACPNTSRMIALLEKMSDGITPNHVSEEQKKVTMLLELVKSVDLPSKEVEKTLQKVSKKMFVKPSS